MKITVQFDRIGRNHNPEPITVEAANQEEAAEKVLRVAGKGLGSRGRELSFARVDRLPAVGDTFYLIVGGFQPAGTGTVTEVQA